MDSLTHLLKAIFPCLPIGIVEGGIQLPAGTARYQDLSEKAALQFSPRGGQKSRLCNDEAATSIVSAMLDADKSGPSLDATIQSLVHKAGGWSDTLAKKIITALKAVIVAGKPMKAAMQEAVDKASEVVKTVEGFAADHPMATEVFCTVIALGVLVVLVPYVVEWLGFCAGFGELGPIEGKSRFLRSVAMGEGTLILDTGSWAAVWQSTYRGVVPKKSLFSYFQRLGMTWKRV